MIKKLLVVSFLLCASQQTSFAQDAAEQKLPALEIKEHITGLDIEAHFDAIEKLYTGAKPDMDAIGKFVEDYPLDGFVLTENVLTNRGTRTPETIVREKDSFIKEEKERVYELLNTRIRHTITDIAYMDDNLSASVTYTSLFQGTLKKDTQTYGIATMGFKSLSVCTNILKLVNGQIKGVKADCKTEIIYDDPVPVNQENVMTYNPELLDKAKRHPEKQKNPDRPAGRKPEWIRVRAPQGKVYAETKDLVRKQKLTTVCEEAGCPNIGECWQQKHATFMILGEVCTRACAFCNVATGRPDEVDKLEPLRIGVAVKQMGLKHVVITAVDRDDLKDGGADHFVKTIQAIRMKSPGTTVEILPGDYKGNIQDIDHVIAAKPDVFNHNLETVPRLYPSIRPGARYFRSLRLLERVKDVDPTMFTKSGMMVGLGESKEEVMQVMDDMRAARIDFITIGQYLQPTPKHAPVMKWWTPEEFAELERIARSKGFLMVSATPLTRSSHHAGDDFAKLKAARDAKYGATNSDVAAE